MPEKSLLSDNNGNLFAEYFDESSPCRILEDKSGMNFKISFNKRRVSRPVFSGNNSACPFDNRESRAHLDLERHYLTPNWYPFSKNHSMLIPFRHYSLPTLEDLRLALSLSAKLNQTVTLNIAGSGASVKQHLHFHCFDERLPIVSCLGKEVLSNYPKSLKIESLYYPAYCLKISGSQTAEFVHGLLEKFSQPYNLVFFNGFAIFIPRKIEAPLEGVAWNFGAAEIGGFLVAGSKEFFDSADNKLVCGLIAKAGFSEKKEIEILESGLLKALNCEELVLSKKPKNLNQ
ncbi:MAG: hypothetical protein Q7R70_04530 [Candidatus Diapherotrites archaeon]|nr:hypothetical protein [Candidatus Diapherotrites archaeon]